jgi:hypothetical protein
MENVVEHVFLTRWDWDTLAPDESQKGENMYNIFWMTARMDNAIHIQIEVIYRRIFRHGFFEGSTTWITGWFLRILQNLRASRR